MEQIRFTFPEMLSLIGVFQCVYILVYISFRAQKLAHVILPLLYFLVLGGAFFIDFARSYVGDATPHYNIISWVLWNFVIPLGVLLIIQMARIAKLPPLSAWTVLGLVPLAFVFSVFITLNQVNTCQYFYNCPDFLEFLNVSGMVAGAISLLVIWGSRGLFEDLHSQTAGQERYWLILSLIIINIFFLASSAVRLGGGMYGEEAILLRTILGLAFSYLVSTSLFRIYPLAVILLPEKKKDITLLSSEERQLAIKIENLLALEKIYHESNYSRSDLARELGATEGAISRVINIHFQKSFPQLLNEYRVKDAKQLLLDTNATIKVVAQEVGFNSLPSFNRVFKEIEGRSPSDFRNNMIK